MKPATRTTARYIYFDRRFSVCAQSSQGNDPKDKPYQRSTPSVPKISGLCEELGRDLLNRRPKCLATAVGAEDVSWTTTYPDQRQAKKEICEGPKGVSNHKYLELCGELITLQISKENMRIRSGTIFPVGTSKTANDCSVVPEFRQTERRSKPWRWSKARSCATYVVRV